jgi:hypothetical protein
MVNIGDTLWVLTPSHNVEETCKLCGHVSVVTKMKVKSGRVTRITIDSLGIKYNMTGVEEVFIRCDSECFADEQEARETCDRENSK